MWNGDGRLRACFEAGAVEVAIGVVGGGRGGVTVSGGLIVVGWLVGLLFIAVAGMDFSNRPHGTGCRRCRSGWVSMAVPYAPVLFACGVAASVSGW